MSPHRDFPQRLVVIMSMRIQRVRVTGLSLVYGLISLIMIFVNKVILSRKVIEPDALLIIQCLVGAVTVFCCSFASNYSLRITVPDFMVCLTVNISFVAAMLANSYTLKYLSIHMVTLLKCLAVVVTALAEYIIFKQYLKPIIWFSLFLIVIGSAIGLATDIEYSLIGYFWMLLAIVFATWYVVMSKTLVSHRDVPFFTAVFWNNFTGMWILFGYNFIMAKGGLGKLIDNVFGVFYDEQKALSPMFVVFSGILGLLLNVSTFSLLGETSATSYVVVGASKKILQAIISFIWFSTKPTVLNVISVMIGLSGATLYAYIKWIDSTHKLTSEDNELLMSKQFGRVQESQRSDDI